MSGHGTALGLGQFAELGAAVLKALPRDIDPDDVLYWASHGKELAQALQALKRKAEEALFSRDMAKEGWDIIENAQSPWPITIADLELVSFLGKDKHAISSEEMRKRAKELDANLGQRQAEYLLEHQKEIPAEWREFYLVFAGTVWHGRDGHHGVPCLNWNGERWYLSFYWLELDWHPLHDRLVRLVRLRK